MQSFWRHTENSNNISSKEVFVPHQIVRVPIVTEKHNYLPNKDQIPEQPLVNQDIPVQQVVELASI